MKAHYHYHYTLFLPKARNVCSRQAAVEGRQNPTPCWTRQIQARPHQPWARCSVFILPLASRGHISAWDINIHRRRKRQGSPALENNVGVSLVCLPARDACHKDCGVLPGLIFGRAAAENPRQMVRLEACELGKLPEAGVLEDLGIHLLRCPHTPSARAVLTIHQLFRPNCVCQSQFRKTQ